MGRNLERLRTDAGLSQAALAQLVTDRGDRKVAPADISRIESGEIQEPSASILKAIADALEKPIAEFWAKASDIRDRMFRDSLAEFLRTDDVKPEELSELQQAVGRIGAPTVQAWREALATFRRMR